LYGGYYSLKYKKIKWLIGGIIFLVLSISLSLVLFPSFKNKIKYMVWDIKSTIENKAQFHTSDRIRIYSIANGIKIFKEHPLFGTGIGDLENEMKLKYKENYPELPEDMQFEPINQFVYILSGMGIIGFILYFGLLILPIFIIKNKHKLLVPFYILTFATFIGETTIEFMIGKTTFLILASLFICYNNNEE
ncbi:MAG TPA: O-antigen ligase domain-containing protein, partial [Bacteroidetes bacterium]|nr:O-antigen ligase domain-containing protein [Bacteroidota bacterium]